MRDDEGQTDTGKVDIGNTDTNTFNFTNTYVQEAGTGTDPTNPDPIYNQFGSLNVSKKIVNAMVQQQLLTMSSLSQQPLHPERNRCKHTWRNQANGGDVTLAEGRNIHIPFESK